MIIFPIESGKLIVMAGMILGALTKGNQEKLASSRMYCQIALSYTLEGGI